MPLKVEAIVGGGYVNGDLGKFPVIVNDGDEVIVSAHPQDDRPSYLYYTLVGQALGGYIKGNGLYPKEDFEIKRGQSTQHDIFTIIGS